MEQIKRTVIELRQYLERSLPLILLGAIRQWHWRRDMNRGDILDILLVVAVVATLVSISAALEHGLYLYLMP